MHERHTRAHALDNNRAMESNGIRRTFHSFIDLNLDWCKISHEKERLFIPTNHGTTRRISLVTSTIAQKWVNGMYPNKGELSNNDVGLM